MKRLVKMKSLIEMKKVVAFLALAVMTLTQGSVLQAEIVLELSDVTVAAGSTAVVTASIADTSGSSRVLSEYAITLDIDDTVPGFSVDGAGAFSSSTSALATFGVQESIPAAGQNFDFGVNGSGGNLTLSATGTDLFQIEFTVDADAQVGAVLPVNFVPDPSAAAGPTVFPQPTFFSFTLDSESSNGEDLPGLIVNQGSITVEGVVVPEPGSAVIVVALGGIVLCRRRR